MNVKWVLSKNCSECRRCRWRGEADLYGLGAGVYPFDRFPTMPAHRGCNCTVYAR